MALQDFTVIYNRKPILVRARNKRDAIKRVVKKECDGKDGSNVLKSEKYLEQNILPELKIQADASETIYNYTDLKACMYFLRYDADPQIVECDDEDFIETILDYSEFVLEKYGTEGKKGRLTASERQAQRLRWDEAPRQQIHSPAYSRSAMGKNPEKRVAFLEFWDRYYNEYFDKENVGGGAKEEDIKKKARKKVAKKELRKSNVGARIRTPSPSPEPVREPSPVPEPVREPSPVPEPVVVPRSNDTEILIEAFKYFNVDAKAILANANRVPNYFKTEQFLTDTSGSQLPVFEFISGQGSTLRLPDRFNTEYKPPRETTAEEQKRRMTELNLAELNQRLNDKSKRYTKEIRANMEETRRGYEEKLAEGEPIRDISTPEPVAPPEEEDDRSFFEGMASPSPEPVREPSPEPSQFIGPRELRKGFGIRRLPKPAIKNTSIEGYYVRRPPNPAPTLKKKLKIKKNYRDKAVELPAVPAVPTKLTAEDTPTTQEELEIIIRLDLEKLRSSEKYLNATKEERAFLEDNLISGNSASLSSYLRDTEINQLRQTDETLESILADKRSPTAREATAFFKAYKKNKIKELDPFFVKASKNLGEIAGNKKKELDKHIRKKYPFLKYKSKGGQLDIPADLRKYVALEDNLLGAFALASTTKLSTNLDKLFDEDGLLHKLKTTGYLSYAIGDGKDGNLTFARGAFSEFLQEHDKGKKLTLDVEELKRLVEDIDKLDLTVDLSQRELTEVLKNYEEQMERRRQKYSSKK